MLASIAQAIVSIGAGLLCLYLLWGAWSLHVLSMGFTGRPSFGTPVLAALASGAGYIAYLFWPFVLTVGVQT